MGSVTAPSDVWSGRRSINRGKKAVPNAFRNRMSRANPAAGPKTGPPHWDNPIQQHVIHGDQYLVGVIAGSSWSDRVLEASQAPSDGSPPRRSGRLLASSGDMNLSRSIAASITSSVWPVACIDVIEARTELQDFLSLNFDVGRLPLGAARRLVDHDPAVGQRETLARRRRSAAASPCWRPADADGRNRRPDVLHGVVDRETRRDVAARRVDVEGDILVGFSDSRNKSCAQIRLATPSLTGPIRKMMRSFKRRE